MHFSRLCNSARGCAESQLNKGPDDALVTRDRRAAPHALSACCWRSEDDTIGDLKKLLAAQIGTRAEKLRIQKWYTIYKDHITLEDYEIHDGMGLELYYN